MSRSIRASAARTCRRPSQPVGEQASGSVLWRACGVPAALLVTVSTVWSRQQWKQQGCHCGAGSRVSAEGGDCKATHRIKSDVAMLDGRVESLLHERHGTEPRPAATSRALPRLCAVVGGIRELSRDLQRRGETGECEWGRRDMRPGQAIRVRACAASWWVRVLLCKPEHVAFGCVRPVNLRERQRTSSAELERSAAISLGMQLDSSPLVPVAEESSLLALRRRPIVRDVCGRCVRRERRCDEEQCAACHGGGRGRATPRAGRRRLRVAQEPAFAQSAFGPL